MNKLLSRSRLTRVKEQKRVNFINKLKTAGYISLAFVSFLGVWTKFSYDYIENIKVQANAGLISPIPVSTISRPLELDAISPIDPFYEVGSEASPKKTEKHQILEYIVMKFGDDADDAITMIRKCENSKFDPKVTNYNRNGTWDAGIFQVNQIHGYTLEQMQDWKQNIDAAYKIYKADNNSFFAWSCAGVINQASYKDSL